MTTNALTTRTTGRGARALAPPVPAAPLVPTVLRSELSRAMEPPSLQRDLLPLDERRHALAVALADQIDLVLSQPIHPDTFAEWLAPIRLSVRNPPPKEEYPYRRAALFRMLSDLPAVGFTAEAQTALATEYFPSALDIRRAVEPAVTRLRETLAGLRRIPKGEPEIAREAPPQDPAIGIAAVRAFNARQQLMDGRMGRFAAGADGDE